MDFLRKARKLESTLARTLDRAAQGWANSGPREPLEILHAVIDSIEERVEPAGRGRHVFPFNKIKLSVVAESRDARARFAAVLDKDPPLQARIEKRLRDAGCDPADVRVTTVYVARPEPHWTRPEFHIVFDRVVHQEAATEERGPAPGIKVTSVQGLEATPNYTVGRARDNCCSVMHGRVSL